MTTDIKTLEKLAERLHNAGVKWAVENYRPTMEPDLR
jgi:hypothetical protein